MNSHHTEKIQSVILCHLRNAQNSIKVAVAWMNNAVLINQLIEAVKNGLMVEIILNKDDINQSDKNCELLQKFVFSGGYLRWNDSDNLMHHKFCVIDEKIVIYGSYNWTYRAERYNEESVTISENETDTITFYVKLFEELRSKYGLDLRCQSINEKINLDKSSKQTCQPSSSCYNLKEIVASYGSIKLKSISDSSSPTGKLYGLENYACIDKSLAYNYVIILPYKFYKYQYCNEKNIWLWEDGIAKLYDTKKNELLFSARCDEILEMRKSHPLESHRIIYEAVEAFIVSEQNKFGIVSPEGSIILPLIYDEIKAHQNIAIIRKGNLYGLADKDGIVIECNLTQLFLGWKPSVRKDKYGLISDGMTFHRKDGTLASLGEIVVPFEYDEIYPCDDNDECYRLDVYFLINNTNGKYQCYFPEYGDISPLLDLIPPSNPCVIQKIGKEKAEQIRQYLYQSIIGESSPEKSERRMQNWRIGAAVYYLKDSPTGVYEGIRVKRNRITETITNRLNKYIPDISKMSDIGSNSL